MVSNNCMSFVAYVQSELELMLKKRFTLVNAAILQF